MNRAKEHRALSGVVPNDYFTSITLRVTKAEKEQWLSEAGGQNLSDFIRQAVSGSLK